MFSVPTTDQRRGGAESAGEGQGEGQGEGEGPEGGKERRKRKKKKDSIASRPRGRGEAGGVGSAAAEATGATRSSEARPTGTGSGRWSQGLGGGGLHGDRASVWGDEDVPDGMGQHSNMSHRVPRSRALKNGENGDFDLMRILLQINFFFRRGRKEGGGRRAGRGWGGARKTPTGGGRGGQGCPGPSGLGSLRGALCHDRTAPAKPPHVCTSRVLPADVTSASPGPAFPRRARCPAPLPNKEPSGP